ncbi:MAG: peptide deformylase [Paracoccus sp. (in: a-proteobacteria)]|uniref:peptide deformylase n=1 Tax=Paracoccus sp. TaxID=267 RepID=UPI0039E5650D
MPERLTGQDLDAGPDGPDPARLTREGVARSIRQGQDPVLRQSCAAAGQLDWERLRRLAADLLATMYHAQGRGLAAPQIGQPYRLFVMDAGWKEGAPRPRIILDPQILVTDETTEVAVEACLSLPGLPVPVARPRAIRLDHFNLLGEAECLHLDGIEARIAQHEADHLNGRLITDHLE